MNSCDFIRSLCWCRPSCTETSCPEALPKVMPQPSGFFNGSSSGKLFLAATSSLGGPLRLRSVIASLCASLSLSVVFCHVLLALLSSHGLITEVHKEKWSKFKLHSVASVCCKGSLHWENFRPHMSLHNMYLGALLHLATRNGILILVFIGFVQ